MAYSRSNCVLALGLSLLVMQPALAKPPVVTPAPASPVPAQVTPPEIIPDAPVKPPVTAPADKPAAKVVPPKVAAKKLPPVKPKAATDALRPGQFVWESRAKKDSETKIVIVLDIQRLYVFQDGALVAFSTVSSGKSGHETPPGIFPILEKDEDHKSTIYDDAPMPFMQRLTWDGVALHAGHNPGFPASHGCVRMPPAFAKLLYGVTKYGQKVVVMRDLDTPPPPPVEVKPVEPPKPVVPVPPVDPAQPAPVQVKPPVVAAPVVK